MRPVLVQNARIIDPAQKIDQTGSLLIDDGKIAWLGKASQKPPVNDSESRIQDHRLMTF